MSVGIFGDLDEKALFFNKSIKSGKKEIHCISKMCIFLF